MTEFSLINKIVISLITVISIWLASWVYFTKRESEINKTFFLYTIFYTLWIIFGYFANLITSHNLALFFMKLRFGAVYLCATTTYFFSLFFPRREKIYPLLSKGVLSFGIIFALISIFTNLIIQDIEFKEWGTNVIFGEGWPIFFGGIIILALIIPAILYKKYFGLLENEKLQIQYFLIGVIIFIGANLVFNVFSPIFLKTYKYYQLGDYSAIFLLAFTAIAIVKRQLFGIKIVLTGLIVGIISILLSLDIFIFTPELWFKMIKGLILLVFLYFGYLLIRSVLVEIKRREEMERLTTKLKVAEEELKIANEELKHANKHLAEMDQAKSEFMSIASHQLRTPLTGIMGYLSMILEGDFGKLSGEQQQMMEEVFEASRRLIRLVNIFLNITRIEAGRFIVNYVPVDMKKIIEEEVRGLMPSAEKKGLKLIVNVPDKLPLVSVDVDKIKDVILNLIDNAIKYTQAGSITISAQEKQGELEVAVKDTGVGIESQEAHKLFQKFVRAGGGAKIEVTGAGLGLYIVKKIVEAHHGRVWVESEGIDHGSTFKFTLPLGNNVNNRKM